MPLTPVAETDEITRFRMIVDLRNRQGPEISYYSYRNVTTGERGSAGPPFDLDEPVFRELNRRIDAGTLVPTWVVEDSGRRHYWTPDQIPAHLEPIFELIDPFRRIDATAASSEEGLGPKTEFWFQRGATAPSLPSFATFDHVAGVTLASLMTGGGWSRSTPTGSDTLYWTRVTWSVILGVSTASASPVDTDDIRYSTDGGDTFTDTPPADMSTVEVIEIYQAGYGWIEYPLRETVVNPLVYISGNNWQNAQNGADNADQYINLSSDTDLLNDNYAIGFTIDTKVSWSNFNTQVSGSAYMPVENLKMVYPYEVEEYQNAGGHIGFKTYMLVMNREHGGVELGLSHTGSLTTDYDATYYSSFKFVFVAFPETSFTEAVNATQTTVYLNHISGLSNGDMLFCEDEQMEITSIGTTRDSAHNNGYAVGVLRGRNGTSAAAHTPTVVRGIVNRDAVRHLCITQRNGVPDHTHFRIFRLRKRGAE